jgi:hypothetical protein
MWTNLKINNLNEEVRVMVFNNISVLSWWSVLLMEETGVLGENHRPAASHSLLQITRLLYHPAFNEMGWFYILP